MDKNIRVTPWPPFKRSNTTITQRTSGDTINSTGNLTFSASGLAINAANAIDADYLTFGARDSDTNAIVEVARLAGATDPYFATGGSQQFKFYNSGIATFDGAATSAAFIDISPTLTGPAATNTYAVNISPVGITIPTGTTAIAASLYVAEPIFTETGTLTLGATVYIDAAPTEGDTNYSLYIVGTTYAGGTITGSISGNAGTVTNATLSTALTVNTGTLTLTAAAANNSVLTIGAGAVSVSGANTGDDAANSSSMYIGTTSHALNRGSGAETLAGITLTTPDIGTPSAGTLTNCTGYVNDIILTKGKQINLTLPDTDATCTGNVSSSWASAYTSSAIGDLVFFNGTEWAKTDSDAVATCNGLLGIALEVKADGVAMKVALPGSIVHLDAWNWTPGATLYVGDDTAGTMEETIPTGADAIIRVVGFAMDADTVFFLPESGQQSTVA